MLPGLNLAEPGQGAMDWQTPHILSLVDCAYKDIAFQMRQDTKYRAELNNEDVMQGRCLNYAEIVEQEHQLQEKRAHIYGNSLQTGDMNLEQTVLQNPQSFILDESASHKFINSAKQRKKHPKKKTIGKQTTTASTQPACESTSGTHRDNSTTVSPIDNADQKLIVPEHFEQQFLETRVPTVVFYNQSFKTCYNSRCKYQWDPKYIQPPFNMLFHMKTQCKRPTKHEVERNCFLSNAYYCFQNLDCLRSELPGVQVHHVYMGNFYFQGLTDGQIGILKNYGYWEHIVANRRKNIAECKIHKSND